MKRFVCLLTLLAFVALAPLAHAVKATPLTCKWEPNYSGWGLFDDGNYVYDNGVGRVRCYFGVNNKDVDLVTYNSGRTLHFIFSPADAETAAAAGLPSDFNAEVDLFGINYYGPFTSMGVGTTAQVQMDLEFHRPDSPLTYELDYSSLAATRLTQDTWLITSEVESANMYAPFAPSSLAKLNVVRRRSTQTFGTVDMPIRFTVHLK